MMKSALTAFVVGLSILGCDSNRTATNDRTTIPSTNPPLGASAAQMNATDQALAQRVANALQDDASLAPIVPNMTIRANGGMVTLQGSVNSQQQRTDIESKARAVTGVTQVINNLEVASTSR